MTRLLCVSLFLLANIATVHAQRGPLNPLPGRLWDRAAAEHLLRRAGFGGSPEEIDRLAALGLDAAVDHLVDYHLIPYDAPPPELESLVAAPVDRAALRRMSAEERQQYVRGRRRAERQAHRVVREWWLERMLHSPRPLQEKLTLFWHGHFTSGAREVRRAEFMLQQNVFLRTHAVDDFRELLLGISRDPAMLIYLDNARNTKQQPNENYARELLELFTLGEGHYAESDIKAAARAFTGWTLDGDHFRFRPRLHDDGVKSFLGRIGPLDGEDVIDVILTQKQCARFLATKLLEFFCTPAPDRRFVERLAAEIRQEDYKLRPALKTLFKSQGFYDADVRGSLIKSPVELLIGTARQLQVPIEDLPLAERALAALGQELMQPPNVKGWDGGEKWINTAALLGRYNVVSVLLDGAAPRPQRKLEELNDEEVAEAGMHGPPARSRESAAYDPRPELRATGLREPEEIVTFYLEHLLATPLDDVRQALLVQYLQEGGPLEVTSDEGARRVRTLVQLICSTPEYQMN